MLDKKFFRSIAGRLQKERRALVKERQRSDQTFEQITDTRETELEERAQEERDTRVLENMDERREQRLADIDDALARIDAGTFGRCQNCGRAISEERLRSNPTTTLCVDCAARREQRQENIQAAQTEPQAGPALPPDLSLLDDGELAEHLTDVVREDGQVDMDELQICARSGVVVLEGALPSEAEHQILLNILTDVAGIQEIDDRLEVVRLAWERDDRSKDESAEEVAPGTIPNQEPYAGTDDVVLSEEEGVAYEPPTNPPAPPYRKD
jgi:DnaK suppressor protein